MACSGCGQRGEMIGQAARHIAVGQYQPALAALAPLPASLAGDAARLTASVQAAAAAAIARATGR
jgi:hypothetical protein